MNSPLSIRTNFASTLVGNIIYTGCQWLTMVIIARLGTPEMVGQFALALALSAPILASASLQLRTVQATDALDRYEFRDFFVLRSVSTSLGLLVIAGIAVLSNWSFQSKLVIIIVGLRGAIESFSDLIYGYFQKRERLDIIGRGMAVRGVAGLAAVWTSFWMTRSIVTSLLVMTTAWLAGLLLYEVPQFKAQHARTHPRLENRRIRVAIPKIKALIVASLPLAVVMLLLSSSQSLPRFLLQKYAGERSLGFFSAVSTLSGGVGLVYMALGQAALPALAKIYVTDTKRFTILLTKMLLTAIVPGTIALVVVYLFGSTILSLTYGVTFAGYGRLLTGMTIVAVINNLSSLLGVGATASGYYWPQMMASLVILGTAAVSAALWIPKLGVSGAMYSVLATALATSLIYAYLCLYLIERPRDPARIGKTTSGTGRT